MLQNPNSTTYIDLILTNLPRSFQSTYVIETGLSDFHLMTLTVMRKFFKRIRSRIINYRCFKQLSNETFREILTKNLSSERLVHNDKELQRFCKVCIETVNDFAPIKQNKKKTLERVKCLL